MSLLEVFVLNAALVAGLMLLVWIVSLLLRDVSIVDIAWGSGFVVIAWATALATGVNQPQTILLAALTTVWGLRLSGYLAWRNLGKPEDYRYRQMRERHGSRFPLISLFLVFGLQGVIMWVVSLPLQSAPFSSTAGGLGWLAAVGVLIWAVGLFFETVGDLQLARFKGHPANRGKVMDRGLWRYTRHPNYFGDFLVWWGLYLVSFGDGSMWWSAIGPIVMSVFLMRVSGVTLLEKSLKERKEGFAEYTRRTSSFFPMPPKRTP